MIDALLVGSRAGWHEKIDPVLANYGIRVRWWWETRRDTGPIPANCGVVLVATDCNAHTVSEPAMRRAREAGVPVHTIVHRKAALIPMLERAGFTRSTPEKPMPTVVRTPTASIAVGPVPALPPMPPVQPPVSPRYSILSLTEKDSYPKVLRFLAANPWATATQLAETCCDGSKGTAQRVASAARDTLGIEASMGSGAAKIVNRTVYEAWCRKLDVTPCPESVGPVREWKPAMRRGPTKPQAAAPEPPVAPKAPEAPPVVPKAAPAMADVRAAIALLREAMAREGVESITVTPTTATVTRRIVVTESLD